MSTMEGLVALRSATNIGKSVSARENPTETTLDTSPPLRNADMGGS
jgi:hypothetical protein